MSRASEQRRKKLWRKRQKVRTRVLYSESVLCGFLSAAKSEPLLRARVTTHYRERHPNVDVVVAPPTQPGA